MGRASYDSPGKQAFRELFAEVGLHYGCRTLLDFWGWGEGSRHFVTRGFDVTACEVTEAKHEAMREDGERHGYQVFAGNARQLRQRFDAAHVDCDGNASGENGADLAAVAHITDGVLAVTLSIAHQLNETLSGEFGLYGYAAWVEGAANHGNRKPPLHLIYMSRYPSDSGQTMLVFLLKRRERGTKAHSATIVAALIRRGWWASKSLLHTGLLPFVTPYHRRSDDYHRSRRAKRRKDQQVLTCRTCERVWTRPAVHGRPPVDCHECRANATAKRRARRCWYCRRKLPMSARLGTRYDSERCKVLARLARQTPSQLLATKSRQREWYLRKKAA